MGYFVKLVVIYRDHVEGSPPLLHGLLCTEVIEHVFGLFATIVKAFTEKGLQRYGPKLFIKIRQAIFITAHATDGGACQWLQSDIYDGRAINMTALIHWTTHE